MDKRPTDVSNVALIRVTFDAYKQPGYENFDDEEHVMRALVRYAMARYGLQFFGLEPVASS